MIESQIPNVGIVRSHTDNLNARTLVGFALVATLLGLGVLGIMFGYGGVSNTLTLMSAVLTVGALLTLRSVFARTDIQAKDSRLDSEVLQQLVAMNRRATLLSDLQGRRIATNDAFTTLTGDPLYGLSDVVADDVRRATLARLVTDIRRTGTGESMFRSGLAQHAEVSLSGKRVGQFILWEVRGEGIQARLKREAQFIQGWAAPMLATLDCGVAIEDGEGKLFHANTMLRSWLGLGPSDALPDRLALKADAGELHVGAGRRIDVSVATVPLSTREKERNIGQTHFIRNLEGLRASFVGQHHEGLIDPIFDSAPIAIAVVEADGSLVEFNRTLLRVSAQAEVDKGGSITSLLPEEQRGQLLELIEQTQAGQPPLHPLDVHFKGKTDRAGQIYFSSLLKGEKRYSILYLSDKTQEKQLEQQFVQAQKMQAVGQLAGGVAHDFNNLLTAIIGFCDLLLLRHDTGDRSFSDLIQIKQNANRAANLVRQLLAFSRQQVVRPVVLDITEVLAELSNLIRRLIGEKIDFSVVHGRNLPRIKADQGQLEQVIINLAVNARDAMASGGKLTVSSRSVGEGDPIFSEFDVIIPGDYLLIEVADTGTGIPADIRSKIFEPFFTTKGVGEGTGLGLATVYGIVKQTGGYVFCRSEVGEGTSFLVLLRALEGEEVDAPKPKVEEKSQDLSGRGKLMLVEDEDSVRLFSARALASKGYDVIDAASGEIGLQKFMEHKDDLSLIVTDVVMPEMDGPTMVEEIRKVRPEIPVIFVSGYAEDLLSGQLELPVNHFLGKPFSLKALAELVKSVLGDDAKDAD